MLFRILPMRMYAGTATATTAAAAAATAGAGICTNITLIRS